jgi:Gpi18-like mannosyltransferase
MRAAATALDEARPIAYSPSRSPMQRDRIAGSGLGVATAVVAVAGSIAALALRYWMRDTWNSDLQGYLVPWYDYIRRHGGFAALGEPFSEYTPPYLYLLAAVTYVPWLATPVTAIKSISVAFDFFAAAVMWKLVRRRYPSGPAPLLAYLAVLFAPTIVLNSSHWGQCDITYSAWLLACVYAACAERPAAAVLCFAVAFAFKLQSVFLAPFLLVLLLRGRIPWRCLALVPVVYVLLILPAALLGRSWAGLLTIYAHQTQMERELSLNAPNLYVFFGRGSFGTVYPTGLAVAAAAVLAYVAAGARSRRPFDPSRLLLAATCSVALVPFVLPKMHDRYFFPADLLSIGLAFHVPRLWFVPLFFQLSSSLAYAFFLGFRAIDPALAVRAAALINTGQVVTLLSCWLLRTRKKTDPNSITP